MAKSKAEIVAELSEEEQAEVLDGIDPETLLYDWGFWARPEQLEPEGEFWSVWAIVAGRGHGKALEASTPIPTPDGWTQIGDLSRGDVIFAHDGTPTYVTDVYRPDDRRAAKVTFHDGTEIIAALTHEWTVLDTKDKSAYRDEHDPRSFNPDWWSWSPTTKTRGPGVIIPRQEILERSRVLHDNGLSWRAIEAILKDEFPSARPQEVNRRRLKTIIDDGTFPEGKAYRRVRHARTVTTDTLVAKSHSIFAAGALDLPDVDLPIDPYALGIWLGDGSTRDGGMCAHVDDASHYLLELKKRGYDDVRERVDPRNPNLILINSTVFRAQLRSNGLLGDKRIPAPYLRASYRQRLDLLRGLMDTDGSIDPSSSGCGAGFVRENLRDAAHELAVSLGYVTRRRVRVLPETAHRPKRPFFIVDFRPQPGINPFSLPRKANRVSDIPLDQSWRKVSRLVTNVQRVDDCDLVCIAVDAPSHLFLAGESMVPTHNTRSGAEWVRDKAKVPNTRIALVGRTSADPRQVMIEGESGIMSVTPPSEKPVYKPSNRELHWPNGSVATTFTSVEPDQLRGPQFHYAWCDEMAAWNHVAGVDGLTAWDNVQIATRLQREGAQKTLCTTTPKRVPAMKDLLKREGDDVVITRGSTLENAGNLGKKYIKFIFGMYAGTRQEQQELDGIMLDEVEGALWHDDIIHHTDVVPLGLPYKVIAVDPSVAEEPTDECGIVVAAGTAHRNLNARQAYILEDASVHGSPDVWAKQVVRMWEKWQCPVVVEVNQGGALVKKMIHGINGAVPVIEVRAKVGKALRAEPVLLKYDQSRVTHVGWLGELEAQMTSWVPGETKKSPDRVDALVYAVTALLVAPPRELGGGKLRAKSAAKKTLPVKQGTSRVSRRR